MSLPFHRFKNNNLTLLYTLFPDDYLNILVVIKYKKLFQCIIKEDKHIVEENSLYGHTQVVNCIIKLSKTQIASGSDDFCIKIWDLPSGKCLKTLKGNNSIVTSIAKLSKTRIVSGSWDNFIKIWDIPTERCLITICNFSIDVSCVIKLSKSHLASGDHGSEKRNGSIKIWDINTGKSLKSIDRKSVV